MFENLFAWCSTSAGCGGKLEVEQELVIPKSTTSAQAFKLKAEREDHATLPAAARAAALAPSAPQPSGPAPRPPEPEAKTPLPPSPPEAPVAQAPLPPSPPAAPVAPAQDVQHKQPAQRVSGVLAATIKSFRAALADERNGSHGSPVVELLRLPLVDGFQSYVASLNALGGNMGEYLQTNIKKLQHSKADGSLNGYREWLISELPYQKPFKGYQDDSGWMANLWIGWTLEFFVDMMAELHSGKDTKHAVDAAYQRTLYNHHNFFQRTAFQVAVKQLPARENLLQALKGDDKSMDTSVVIDDLGDFVAVGRVVVQFLLKANEEMSKLMQEERNKK